MRFIREVHTRKPLTFKYLKIWEELTGREVPDYRSSFNRYDDTPDETISETRIVKKE